MRGTNDLGHLLLAVCGHATQFTAVDRRADKQGPPGISRGRNAQALHERRKKCIGREHGFFARFERNLKEKCFLMEIILIDNRICPYFYTFVVLYETS